MELNPTAVIFLGLVVAAFLVQSEWLFFASIALLVAFLYLKAEQQRLENAEEKAEAAKPKKKQQLIIVRPQPVHPALHEKVREELVEDTARKIVLEEVLSKNVKMSGYGGH